MRRREIDPGGRTRPKGSQAFVLYVEGARDREILCHWARRSDRTLARLIDESAFILGGRQPARAVEDFQRRGGASAGIRGLVVLDRDLPSDSNAIPNGRDSESEAIDEPGLDLFVWRRRHIESYLVVPAVLKRLLGLEAEDRRMDRFIEEFDQDSESPHAKKMLGARGALATTFGRELRAGEIAKAMYQDELDSEIHTLFDHIRRATGRRGPARPEVVIRTRA